MIDDNLFDYDDEVPADLAVRGEDTDLEWRVRDIEYRGARGRVAAYLVAPLFTLPVGRVLFLHPAPGDRSSFLPDAKLLAARGISSLLVNAPWADPGFGREFSERPPEEARERFVDAVVDARRGADLLTAGAPSTGLAVVGHSLGAMIGGILTGADARFRAAVLMAGAGTFGVLARLNAPGADPAWSAAFDRALAPLAPDRFVRRASSASFLFQCGLDDRLFSREELVRYFDSAGGEKELRWYETDHFGLGEAGRAERIEWLDFAVSSMR